MATIVLDALGGDDVTRATVYAVADEKLQTIELSLKEKLDALKNSTVDLTQGQLMALQYDVQTFTLFVSVVSSLLKEMADMMKGIIAKF